MRDTLASALGSTIRSLGRKALILGALVGAPLLATAEAAPVHGLRAEAPAAAAQPIGGVERRGFVGGPNAALQTVQWDGPRRRH